MIVFLKKCLLKIRSYKIKNYIKKNEKTFEKDGKSIKYLYSAAEGSQSLAVVFSAFPAVGKSAGYNMVSTFADININKLFILDDFGYENRGAYQVSYRGFKEKRI